jgi:hypothetical protein
LNTKDRSQLRMPPPLYGLRRIDCALVDPLEQYARAGLELAGEQVDDTDVAVIRAADAAYGPDLKALDEADLTDVMPEPDLDPSRPPRARS